MLATEKHYRVKEIAELWGLSTDIVRRLFSKEPGVITLSLIPGSQKRKYITLSIPESVVIRVHERVSNNAPKEAQRFQLPNGKQLRVTPLEPKVSKAVKAAISKIPKPSGLPSR